MRSISFKWSIAAVLPLAAALTCGAPAAKAAPVSVSVGYSDLTGNSNFTNESGFTAGLNFNIPVSPVFSGGTPSVDIDYDNHSGNGGHLYTTAVYLADRYSLTPVKVDKINPYIGLGIGGSYLDSDNHGDSDQRTDVSGKILAGLNFGQNFAEFSYALNENVFGGNTDTLDFSIGEKF